MDYIKEIEMVMSILAGLCPRVDQYATLARPMAYCVNKLADVRDDMQKSAEKPEETKE